LLPGVILRVKEKYDWHSFWKDRKMLLSMSGVFIRRRRLCPFKCLAFF
jgi:hypothetical protein